MIMKPVFQLLYIPELDLRVYCISEIIFHCPELSADLRHTCHEVKEIDLSNRVQPDLTSSLQLVNKKGVFCFPAQVSKKYPRLRFLYSHNIQLIVDYVGVFLY